MKITINEEPIEFTLENEKTALDVVQELNKWIEQSDASIETLSLNNKKLEEIDQQALNSVTIENIDRIDITVQSLLDLEVHRLSLLVEFLDLLHESVSDENKERIDKLKKQYPEIQDLLDETFRQHFHEDLDVSRIATAFDESSRDQWNKEEKTAYLNFLGSVKSVINSRIQEMKFPNEELVKTAQMIAAIRPNLEEVPVLLQTGKDRDAMEHIIRFTELSSRIIRILSVLLRFKETRREGFEPQQIESHYREMNAVLSELVEAFSENDPVLIGDLVEYEILPKLDPLFEIVRRIENANGRGGIPS